MQVRPARILLATVAFLTATVAANAQGTIAGVVPPCEESFRNNSKPSTRGMTKSVRIASTSREASDSRAS